MKLESLDEQGVVIIGAACGIGLVAAKMTAQAGAKRLPASRSEEIQSP